MTVIALPPNHDHLADALVREGFTRRHVDAEARKILEALDPLVEPGAVLANMGQSPRLRSRLAVHDGDWEAAAGKAREIDRLLAAVRNHVLPLIAAADLPEKLVITDVRTVDQWGELPAGTLSVGIRGRTSVTWVDDDRHLLLDDDGVVEQEVALKAWLRERENTFEGVDPEPSTTPG